MMGAMLVLTWFLSGSPLEVPMPNMAACLRAIAQAREELNPVSAVCLLTRSESTTVTIIRNMKREMDDTCRPCIEKHRWEQGWRDTPPW